MCGNVRPARTLDRWIQYLALPHDVRVCVVRACVGTRVRMTGRLTAKGVKEHVNVTLSQPYVHVAPAQARRAVRLRGASASYEVTKPARVPQLPPRAPRRLLPDRGCEWSRGRAPPALAPPARGGAQRPPC